MRSLSIAIAALVTALGAALTFSSADAGGFNLAWDDCGAFGTLQKNFACDTNSGFNQLYVSAISPAPMPQLTAVEVVIDMATNQAVLSDWWSLQTGGCRAGTLTADANFVTGPFNCLDPWLNQAQGGVGYSAQVPAPNRARIRAVFAVATPVTSDGVSEYYLVRLTISNAKTTGTGACSGCTDGACLVLQSVRLNQPVGLTNYTITNPLTSQYAVWQPGGNNPYNPPYGPNTCPGATPAHNSTWGSVKALYR